MSTIWDTPDGKLGKEGEDAILALFRDKGIYVMPASDYNGKDGTVAPMIRTHRDNLILPDFYCAKSGRSWWVEAKAKSAPLHWRKTDTLYHGVDTKQLNHYIHVCEITGLPMWLVVYEKPSGELLLLKDFLRREPVILGTGRIRGGRSSGVRMSNYKRTWFQEIGVVQ